MNAGHSVTITPDDARVEIRLDGELLAATDNALRLDETGLPARFYLPRTAVRFEHLVPSATVTSCPYKGTTSAWWSVRGR